MGGRKKEIREVSFIDFFHPATTQNKIPIIRPFKDAMNIFDFTSLSSVHQYFFLKFLFNFLKQQNSIASWVYLPLGWYVGKVAASYRSQPIS